MDQRKARVIVDTGRDFSVYPVEVLGKVKTGNHKEPTQVLVKMLRDGKLWGNKKVKAGDEVAVSPSHISYI